jgi:hypothetical protein
MADVLRDFHMNDHRIEIGRRQIIKCGVGLAGACALGLALATRNVAAKSPKAALLYQDQPNAGKRCADCKFFSSGGGDSNTGSCALVEGPIDRNGWCMAFSPRN